jgi:hypothetical protein
MTPASSKPPTPAEGAQEDLPMSTEPAPQTVATAREIMRIHLAITSITITPADLVNAVKSHFGDGLEADLLESWCLALRDQLAGATVTAALSWPDEQPPAPPAAEQDGDVRAPCCPECGATPPNWRPDDVECEICAADLENTIDDLAEKVEQQQADPDIRYLTQATKMIAAHVRELATENARLRAALDARTADGAAEQDDVRAVAALLATVSGVCTCERCDRVGRSIYRMVGRCTNCARGPILMLFRTGDKARALDCPFCGCRDVLPQRPATDDEIPAAAPDARTADGGAEQDGVRATTGAVLGATADGRLRIHCPACEWDAIYPCLDLATVNAVVNEHGARCAALDARTADRSAR